MAVESEGSSHASEGILPKSHVRRLGETGQQLWLTPGSRGLPVDMTRLPAWFFRRLSHCRGSQQDLRPIVMPQSSHMRLI
ncbi:hypothetical protein TNCV_1027741 [Trichonephila clavipes]|nr:hypothetical protein TNCV_1027741 [Trichonephila clavipes]